MNWSHFLKSLGVSAGGLILPASGLISMKLVKIYDNYIRGLMHYDVNEIKDSIEEIDEVQLIRESINVYDSFAIQVNKGDKRLGYIAAYENIVLANMMDSGVSLSAYISHKDLKRPAQEWLALEVFAKLVIPSEQLVDTVLTLHRSDDAPDMYRLREA